MRCCIGVWCCVVVCSGVNCCELQRRSKNSTPKSFLLLLKFTFDSKMFLFCNSALKEEEEASTRLANQCGPMTAYLEDFLTRINCQQYIPTFVELDVVKPEQIKHLDREILIAMGITKLNDRLRILKSCQDLHKQDKLKQLNKLNDLLNKIKEMDLQQNLSDDYFAEKYHIIFILNDGSAKKVNVNGCFNADSIKKRLIKRLPRELMVSRKINPNQMQNQNSDNNNNFNNTDSDHINPKDYDVFVVDYTKNVLHLLYDVELVTICHSNDKLERNRLILVSNDQTPSDQAIATSKKIYLKTLSYMHDLENRKRQQLKHSKSFAKSNTPTNNSHNNNTKNIHSNHVNNNQITHNIYPQNTKKNNLRIDNSKDKIRQIFNQRPPSEFISTNLAGYFPEASVKKLEKTLKDSYRQSVRLSMANFNNNNITNNNHNNNYFGNAHRAISSESNKIGDIRLRHATAVDNALLQDLNISRTNSSSSKNSTNSNELSDGGNYNDVDSINIPTKVITPNSWLKGARIGSGSFGSVYLGMNAETGELMAVKQVAIQPKQIFDSNNNKNKIKTKESKDNIKDNNNNNSSNDNNNNNNNSNDNNNNNGKDKNNSKDKNNNVSKDKKKQQNNELNIYRKMVESLQNEINLLKELHHENIVTYYGSSQESGHLNIFLEYVPGGSVSSMLNNYGPFEESLIANFTRQILIGLAYLHRKNIIHRDIKGANILIDVKGCVKITDFGISKKLSPISKRQNLVNDENVDDDSTTNNGVNKFGNNNKQQQQQQQQNKRISLQGSVFWMAPEVVKQIAVTEKVDIWSTGCVIIEMFTGTHPFPKFSQMQAIFKIGTNTSPNIPQWASDDAKRFIRLTFELDYHKRPSAIDLLKHPWLDTHIL